MIKKLIQDLINKTENGEIAWREPGGSLSTNFVYDKDDLTYQIFKNLSDSLTLRLREGYKEPIDYRYLSLQNLLHRLVDVIRQSRNNEGLSKFQNNL